MSLTSLPSFNQFTFESSFRATHAAEIEAARAGTPEQREAIQAVYRLACGAEEKRIEAERKRIAAENAAVFLANPRAVLDKLDEERGRSLYLGEMLLAYGIADVTVKRGKGKGHMVGKGTLAEGTISPFVATVRIGDRVSVHEMWSRNDRRSKDENASDTAARAALDIANQTKAD